MSFHLTLVGLNHRTAAVDIRERFALAEFHSPQNWAIACLQPIQESFILSTCNRVEVLGIGQDSLDEHLLARWSSACGASSEELRAHAYIHHNLDAVRHIFEVASSLDSMILGEPQILGQLKKAYRDAVEARCAGSIVNHLMHHAFTVAKRVRNETAVASNAVSISYAAVELAKRIFGQMAGHKALLIGAGEMAELAATHMAQAGTEQIYVANRTFANAVALAERFHGSAIPFEELSVKIPNVDIIIASTGSKEPIITKDLINKALKIRKNSPIFLIDIAVPRDIDPAVNALDNVYLYDIDDLRDVVEENMAARKEEAAKGSHIIDEEVARFGLWLDSLRLKPTIMDLVDRGEKTAQVELSRTLKRLGPVSPQTRDALEAMAAAIVKKLNHDPIMFLKKTGMGREDPLGRINMVRKIFNLDNASQAKTEN